MTWNSEYYATQDTDHGGRAGISQQRKHLDRLVDLSSSDYLSGYDNYSHGYYSIEGYLQSLGMTPALALIILALVNILLAALNIEVLGIITMELILHNTHRHITLMSDL